MKKRFLAMFLALVMCLALLPTAALAAEEFEMEGTVLKKYHGPGGAVTIPSSVTSIDYSAFGGCTSLTSVTIPSSVTEIGAVAFADCTGLTSVNIPKSVIKIDNNAFEGCTGLTSVTIPESVTSLGEGVFADCTSLTSATFSDGVIEIGWFMFDNYTSLASVTIPKTVTEIGSSVFNRCSALKDVYYGGSEAQWNEIKTPQEEYDMYGDFREDLTDVTIHFNSTGPDLSGQPGEVEPPVSGITFSDVPANEWYAEPVQWAVSKGITNGSGVDASGNLTFGPGDTCTNAHILTFLYRAAGSPEVSAQLPFTPKNGWATDALTWACEKGMIGADFDDSLPCTSASAVKYIWQAKDSPETAYKNGFTDVPATADYAQAVQWAVDNGVTVGDGPNTFSPDQICNRGRIVTFLFRAFK